MRVTVLRVAIAAVLTGAGWAIGHAQGQTQEPDFTLRVVAPGGVTSVECVRGCTFRYTQVSVEGTKRTFQTPSFRQGCKESTCEISAAGVITR